MTSKYFNESKDIAHTIGFLRHRFKFGISGLNDYNIETMKKYGGIDICTSLALSDCYPLVATLTNTPRFTHAVYWPDGSMTSDAATTEQVIATYARLAIMGFGDDPFLKLVEAFPHVARQRGKGAVIINAAMRYALWYDTFKTRGDFLELPEQDSEPLNKIQINGAGTHLMTAMQASRGKVLLFVPLAAKPKQLDILAKASGVSAWEIRDQIKAAKRGAV